MNAGLALVGPDRDKVLPFVVTLFGVRDQPKPDEHARGWVAEFIWFLLARGTHIQAERMLLRVEGPGFHATEPGGDGLTVWRRTTDGVLTFCLWEIKSHTGGSALSGTITRAYNQLNTRATEYLAKLTAVEAAAREHPEINDLYAKLGDYWVDNSDRSGAGVAVATHVQLAPTRCFSTMQNHFPRRTGPWQLEGVIAAVGDFASFTNDVRERVWIAL